MDLFQQAPLYQPLAERLRPENLSEYVGQAHLLADGKPLQQAIQTNQLHSMILWGPPGVGKTTLARIMARQCACRFVSLSAIMSGIKDIRDAVAQAQISESHGNRTVLFIDEVHRFNKSQQDAFLPHIEAGTITFIGATTENPSFELNNALLSRCRVYRMVELTYADLSEVLERAERVLSSEKKIKTISAEAKDLLINLANGDSRRLLNLLEIAVDFADAETPIEASVIKEISGENQKKFDKGGDYFYDLISAFHKTVRGSDADASLYWLCRMLEVGCEPEYIARRLVRIASEDIGNADPRALTLALNAWDVQQRLGSPEGELALAQATLFLATAAKSNAVYTAFKSASRYVVEHPDYGIPLHLRNAPTKLMVSEGFGKGYHYSHDHPDAISPNQSYWPEQAEAASFYQPVDRGLEKQIAEKLNWIKRVTGKQGE